MKADEKEAGPAVNVEAWGGLGPGAATLEASTDRQGTEGSDPHVFRPRGEVEDLTSVEG